MVPEIERLDVVAVAPHPDDLEITCGGTLAMLVKQGYRVGIFDLTTGEPTPRGDEATRAQEAEEARRVLGVHLRINIGLPNRVLMDEPAHRFTLATQLRRYRPSVVITMAGRTPAASPDHHQAHLLTEASRFYSQLTKWNDRFDGTEPYRVPHLVYAPVPFDAEIRHWHSRFVIDISAAIEQKLEAISCYRSQFDADRLKRVKHWISGLNATLGAPSGFDYGEMFALHQPMAGADLFQMVTAGKAGPAASAQPDKALPLG